MKPFRRILYGGDYNPEQWPDETMDRDITYFKEADINSATINVFSWASLQPEENRYDFSKLDAIVEKLSAADMDIVMATSTAAMPAWMFRKYPEVARTDEQGRHHRFGHRHNACPNSPVFRKYAAALAGALAERYKDNPHITAWHVSNEYGGACYCENCAAAFRKWLKKKYGTIENVNQAWNMKFWSHTVYDWDEIVPPDELGDGDPEDKTVFSGLSVDYRRFMSDSILKCFCLERDAIHAQIPDAAVTTNLMGTYKGLDYFRWAKEMDIVSWDNYPAYDTPRSFTAMTHDLMRGLKKQPFMLMEQTPSQTNWQPYNELRRPGEMRALSLEAMAHGADTVQFFQLVQSIGGSEKFHGAVISHAGTDQTRVFREVAELGHELKRLGDELIGAKSPARVAILFDWDSYWALEYSSGPTKDLHYVDEIHRYYQYFYRRNIAVDMIGTDDTLRGYDLVIAPYLYMIKGDIAERLEHFVRDGGVFVTGMMSGMVDQGDNVILGGYPGPLRPLCGVWVEEMDAPAPIHPHKIVFDDGKAYPCDLIMSIMHPEEAESLAVYQNDFYAGTPAVTRNSFGIGYAYYVGTRPDEAGLARVLDDASRHAGVRPVYESDADLEITVRETDDARYWFLMNFSGEMQAVPDDFAGSIDSLTGERVPSELPPFGAAIVKVAKIEM